MKSILITILLLAFAIAGTAQNTIKLFDAVAVAQSDNNMIMNSNPWGMYRSAEVYLSCPASGRLTSSISGPNGGDLIVDNSLLMNGSGLCSGNCFSSLLATPDANIGMAAETVYRGVAPINVSREIQASGLYTFYLVDFGYNYGSSAVYLNTNCSIYPINTPPTPEPTNGGSVVCHRTMGNAGPLTLNVGASAVAAHLAHGDTIGPCGQ